MIEVLANEGECDGTTGKVVRSGRSRYLGLEERRGINASCGGKTFGRSGRYGTHERVREVFIVSLILAA